MLRIISQMQHGQEATPQFYSKLVVFFDSVEPVGSPSFPASVVVCVVDCMRTDVCERRIAVPDGQTSSTNNKRYQGELQNGIML